MLAWEAGSLSHKRAQLEKEIDCANEELQLLAGRILEVESSVAAGRRAAEQATQRFLAAPSASDQADVLADLLRLNAARLEEERHLDIALALQVCVCQHLTQIALLPSLRKQVPCVSQGLTRSHVSDLQSATLALDGAAAAAASAETALAHARGLLDTLNASAQQTQQAQQGRTEPGASQQGGARSPTLETAADHVMGAGRVSAHAATLSQAPPLEAAAQPRSAAVELITSPPHDEGRASELDVGPDLIRTGHEASNLAEPTLSSLAQLEKVCPSTFVA